MSLFLKAILFFPYPSLLKTPMTTTACSAVCFGTDAGEGREGKGGIQDWTARLLFALSTTPGLGGGFSTFQHNGSHSIISSF